MPRAQNPLARPGSERDRYLAGLLAQLARAAGLLLLLLLLGFTGYEILTAQTTGEHGSGDLEL